MRLKVLAPLAAAAVGVGAAVLMALPAQAAHASCNTYRVDDNSRVQGDCTIYSGIVQVWGNCDWSAFNIYSPWSDRYGFVVLKTAGTCWYGVESHGFTAAN
jgi:hypothetical protein